MTPAQVRTLQRNLAAAGSRTGAPMPAPTPARLAALVFWCPLPPSWNRVFKARAIPIGKGRFSAQVYKSAEAKAYAEAVRTAAVIDGIRPFPKDVMLRFSAVVAMERAGCDLDDRLKVYFDALNGVIFEDDEQVAEYALVRRIVDGQAPGVRATFTPIAVDRYGAPT